MASFLSTPENCNYPRSVDNIHRWLRNESPIDSDAFTGKMFSSPDNTTQNTGEHSDAERPTLQKCVLTPRCFSTDGPIESPCETLEEKEKRELEESESLARQLMEEESLNAYNIQLEYMRSHSEELSAEELEVFQIAMRASEADNVADAEAEAERVLDGTSEGQQDADEDSEEWTYDRLLALGQLLGDVKTERWRDRATGVISQLPVLPYERILQMSESQSKGPSPAYVPTRPGPYVDAHNNAVSPTPSSAILTTEIAAGQPDVQARSPEASAVSSTPCAKRLRLRADDSWCAVCMEAYSGVDVVLVLPCMHYFHETCGKAWAADHNSCPTCKGKISCSP